MCSRVFFFILSLIAVLPMTAGVKVTNPRVCSLHRPVGIDENPTFSWQLLSDEEKYGIEQTAYRIVVAENEHALDDGIYIWDSGRVESNTSTQTVYGGPLDACRRYFYKIKVWLDDGTETSFCSNEWFETGLRGSGLGNAKWICSSRQPVSPYRTDYVIEFTYLFHEHSNELNYIFGKRSEKDYNIIRFCEDCSGNTVSIGHVLDGEYIDDGMEILFPQAAQPNLEHSVKIVVFATQYAKKYRFDIYYDGKKIENSRKEKPEKPLTPLQIVLAGRQAEFEINPVKGDLP